MESSILSEGCKHLDSQDGALQCYYYPLNRLPASRLLLPRSGPERSDFVLWPIASMFARLLEPLSGAKRTRSTWENTANRAGAPSVSPLDWRHALFRHRPCRMADIFFDPVGHAESAVRIQCRCRRRISLPWESFSS